MYVEPLLLPRHIFKILPYSPDNLLFWSWSQSDIFKCFWSHLQQEMSSFCRTFFSPAVQFIIGYQVLQDISQYSFSLSFPEVLSFPCLVHLKMVGLGKEKLFILQVKYIHIIACALQEASSLFCLRHSSNAWSLCQYTSLSTVYKYQYNLCGVFLLKSIETQIAIGSLRKSWRVTILN